MGKRSVSPKMTRRQKLLHDALEATDHAARVQSPQVRQVERLTAKNANQTTAMTYLSEGRPIVMLTGSAGTGKSMIAVHHAAKLLQSKKIDHVYLVRPAVLVGRTIGLLPGDIKEKLTPFFKQTLAHFERFLGKGHVAYCIEKGTIEMFPVEYMRGLSAENCVIICEEAQNLTHEDMEMLLTRLGENCQIIFTGDTKQNDLRTESGLKTTVALLNRMIEDEPHYLADEDLDEIEDGVGIVQFTPNDVVRHGLTRAFVKMYYHNS